MLKSFWFHSDRIIGPASRIDKARKQKSSQNSAGMFIGGEIIKATLVWQTLTSTDRFELKSLRL